MTGDQQRGPASGELGELFPQIHAQHRIQAHRGLVEHEHSRLADQRACQRRPGALTAGEVAAVRGSVVCQAHAVDGVIGGPAVVAIQRGEVPHVVDDAQVVVDCGLLRQVSHLVAQWRRARRVTQHGDRARRHNLGADDAAHQRALTASGRTEQAGDGAFCDIDREVAQCQAFAADHP